MKSRRPTSARRLERLDPLWDELFPAEHARIVQLPVERVDVSPKGADITLRTDGLGALMLDLRQAPERNVTAGAEGRGEAA